MRVKNQPVTWVAISLRVDRQGRTRKMNVFTHFNSRLADRPTDQPTSGQSLLWIGMSATKNSSSSKGKAFSSEVTVHLFIHKFVQGSDNSGEMSPTAISLRKISKILGRWHNYITATKDFVPSCDLLISRLFVARSWGALQIEKRIVRYLWKKN